ncbi:MAG: patatin-like phospholipase family protein [Acidobacteriota bacterium]
MAASAQSGSGNTAFVLAGGGSLGAVQVGMLKALADHPVEPAFVVGSSVGAINGAFFAAEPTSEGVARLERIWRGLQRRDIFPITPLLSLLGFLRRNNFLVDPSNLRDLLERNLPFRRLEETHIPFHLVATDAIEGGSVRVSSGPAIDALMASAAIPAVFPPVPLGKRFLMDGAVTSNAPISAAVELGATRLVVLPTGLPCSIQKPPSGVIAMALHALNLLIHRQLVLELERLEEGIQLAVVPPLCPLETSTYDFSHPGELIDRAEESTRHWLAEDGLEAGGVPATLQPHAHG